MNQTEWPFSQIDKIANEVKSFEGSDSKIWPVILAQITPNRLMNL